MPFLRNTILFILVTAMILAGCNQNTQKVQNKEPGEKVQVQETNIDKLLAKTGMNDILWMSIEKDGELAEISNDGLITREKDPEAIAKINDSIKKGSFLYSSIQEMPNPKPIILGFKLANGKYIEAQYIDNAFSLAPTSLGDKSGDKGVVFKPTAEFDQLIVQYTDPWKVTDRIPFKDLKYQGQVRNNKLVMVRTSLGKFWNDPVFKSFKGSNLGLQEYEQSLINDAKKIGINEPKLKRTLETAKTLKGNSIIMYPVIIDTASYKDKDCFVFVFSWEVSQMVEAGKVRDLGHIFIVVVEAETNKAVMQMSCG